MKKKYYSSDKRCIVTGFSPVDLHHVKTRGSGGTDDTWNLMPLAHALHVDVHAIGLTAFAEKYVEAENWLKENGWELCELRKKWVRDATSLKFPNGAEIKLDEGGIDPLKGSK